MNCVSCNTITANARWLCFPCSLQRETIDRLPMLVIGIFGQALHGKSITAAVMNEVFNEKGLKCLTLNMSDIVLEEARRTGLIRAYTRADCRPWDLKRLIALAHDKRSKDSDHWISLAAAQIFKAGPSLAVIAGLRFPNDVEWVRQAPRGLIIKVVRRLADGSLFRADDRDLNDPMESSLNDAVPDFELYAGPGQKEWKQEQARALAHYLITRRNG